MCPGDELVFTSPTGEVLRNNNFRRRVFDRASASIELANRTPHELRHNGGQCRGGGGANVKAAMTSTQCTRAVGTMAELEKRLGGAGGVRTRDRGIMRSRWATR